MSLSVATKKLPGSRVELSITLPWSEVEAEIGHAIKHLAEHHKFEGFRPGKAPREVIEKRLGKEAVLEEAAEHAVEHSYPRVLEQEKLEAIGRPQVTLPEMKEGEPVTYTVVTAVMPTLTLKPWKDAVRKVVQEFAKRETEVAEADIETELRKLAESRAKLVTVNRAAANGDAIEVDFSVSMGGVPIENGTSKKHPMVLGKGAFIPGFEEALVGMQAGEEKSFDLTFPAAYHAKNLAGKPATFKVKLGLVQERQLPELDDAFAQSLGKFENLEALRNTVREGMQTEKTEQLKEERRTKILDTLVDLAEADLPRLLVEDEISKMLREMEAQLNSVGLDMEGYFQKMGKDRAALSQEWEPQAVRRVLSALALETIAKEREIEPSREEIEAEINKTLQYYKNIKDIEKEIDLARLYEFSKGKLRNEAVFALLEKLS